MDKFGGAFSQAKAYAEKGRTHVNAGLSKADQQWQARQRSSSQPQDPADHSPAAVAAPPPPPVSRTRTSSQSTTTTTTGGLFTNLSQTDKLAFFALLDEYFSTRPHLAHLFSASGTTDHEIENLSSFPRRGPLPTSAPTATATSTPTPPPPPPAPPAAPPANSLGYCTALYDYTSTDRDDLNFAEGDRIVLLEIVSDDWWRGELRGKKGIFPSNYAQRS
ncbi:hypothetical protein JCM11491_005237 [Sporobolomyces phaffii]